VVRWVLILPLSYWDWTLDAKKPLESEMWDAWSGFGGNGVAPDMCVVDGLLGEFNASYDKSGYRPHCVKRRFNNTEADGDMHSKHYTYEIVKDILRGADTYNHFRHRLEGEPHRYIHRGIGEEFRSLSSPNGQSASKNCR
jgi:hypothetical protein